MRLRVRVVADTAEKAGQVVGIGRSRIVGIADDDVVAQIT
ncbi:Uncharacterised protein [Mycobacterium tuberculosis]|uniref:Uncharacterized protein n=1 Tax=Mycobacterium tuberculosis TaxID=1773 RepID=A0A916LG45_MYCTX|nr:Uncharacterised protein [Mycobacterium tuberculosis]COY10496.1 Uncharacterised protein [Mycobacterium tuberculosis]CPA60059.1 Uncharacterised protein [Mycobacterium tuberculosis]CPC04138.1 Uncharacterised protein [Mycobacterium tuberculosis]